VSPKRLVISRGIAELMVPVTDCAERYGVSVTGLMTSQTAASLETLPALSRTVYVNESAPE